MTSARAAPSAETLNSASSRATVSSGSRSRILITLTSLCSCLVTWSIGCIAPSSVSVMRDSVGSSVGPTASVSMLKPRRANRPGDAGQDAGLVLDQDREDVLAAGAQPADASSSSSVRSLLGCRVRPCAQPTISRAAAPRRDHRVRVLLARDPHVDHDRARASRAPPAGRRRASSCRCSRMPVRAVGLGELDEVRPLRPCRPGSSAGPRTAPATGGPCPGSRCS